jgi:outer membrane receptor protein involved in Fe transport
LTGSLKLGDDSRLFVEAAAFQAEGLFYTNIGQSYLKDGYYAYTKAVFSFEELELQVIYDQMGINTDFGLVLEYGGLELARLPELNAVMNKVTLRAKHSVNIWHNHATYGAEYISNSYDDAVLVDGTFKERRGGFYLQDEVDLGSILEAEVPIMLTVGVRFDLNSITQWEFSPRASLVSTPIANHSFRVGYAHAFQKPTFFESSLDIHLDDINNFGFDRLDMESDLENETIDSVEVGYHGSFLDDHLVLKVDLAYNWYRNSIIFDYTLKDMEYITIGGLQIPDLRSPGFKFYNEPHGVDGHNLEVQAIVRPTDRSRLFFQAGYRQLFHTAERTFRPSEPVWNLGAGADLSTKAGITLSLRAFYTAERQNSFRGPGGALEPNLVVDLPAYWLLNARLAWQLSDKPFVLQAGVEGFNLLNILLSDFGGVILPNQPDFASERLSRRVIFFLRGDL